ncbi:MAG: Fe-S cluster assembly protein SufD [Zetaproteobacteria bacterium]|nr:MAG: Fe-S cluster assembly protein SufD [Zetaproteobacteria bacterium]
MSALLLQQDNLPTQKEEDWKYTNLSRALGDLKSLPAEDVQEILIHKTCGEVGGKVEDIVWTGVDGQHQNIRLKIILDEGAELTLIERHEGRGAYWKNMSTEIVLGANARLNHIRIQDDALEAVQTNMVHITMERDAYLNSFSLNIGGKLTRHDIHVILNGSNIDCSLNGVNLLKDKQHGDTTILMEHIAPHCLSNQFYRTILDDESRGVFQGKVHVHKDAQKTDGYQLSNTLLLSPKCEMDTKPELEIYADDVKCSHGATTGQLDEEPLFYLRSRGLSEAQARILLVQAFVDAVVDKILDETLRTELKEKMGNWLAIALKSNG